MGVAKSWAFIAALAVGLLATVTGCGGSSEAETTKSTGATSSTEWVPPTTAVYRGTWLDVVDELACGTQRFEEVLERNSGESSNPYQLQNDLHLVLEETIAAYQLFHDRLSWQGWPEEGALRIQELRSSVLDTIDGLRDFDAANGILEIAEAMGTLADAVDEMLRKKADLYSLLGPPSSTPDCSGLG